MKKSPATKLFAYKPFRYLICVIVIYGYFKLLFLNNHQTNKYNVDDLAEEISKNEPTEAIYWKFDMRLRQILENIEHRSHFLDKRLEKLQNDLASAHGFDSYFQRMNQAKKQIDKQWRFDESQKKLFLFINYNLSYLFVFFLCCLEI